MAKRRTMGMADEPSNSTGPKYSIVIPAFNEAERIPATLTSVLECVRAHSWEAEVLVVNDGSSDQTAEVVRAFARTAPEVRLSRQGLQRSLGDARGAGFDSALH